MLAIKVAISAALKKRTGSMLTGNSKTRITEMLSQLKNNGVAKDGLKKLIKNVAVIDKPAINLAV